MNFKTGLALVVGLLIFASPCFAQQRSSSRSSAPKVDVVLMGGYVWTLSQDASYNLQPGSIDIKSGGYFGVAFDIYAHPFAQVRLLYRRQDSKLTWKQAGVTQDIGDMAVEYWHVGAVKGLQQGNVLPFTTFSLGGTRFAAPNEDNWKFSILIGLGAKVYINDRIGLMVAGQMPFSFTDAFVGVGTGGVSMGGTGIAQFDVTGGLVITL